MWSGGRWCLRIGFAAPGRGQGLPGGGGLSAATLAAEPDLTAFEGARVLCRVRSRGRQTRGGARVTGLRSGSRVFRAGGGIRGTGSWSGSHSSSAGGGAWFPGTRAPGVSLLHGGSGAVPRLRGLDSGAPAATAALGAVETRLPDDALTLPNGAATRSSRVPSLPNSRLSVAGLSLLERFSFTRCWLKVNIY